MLGIVLLSVAACIIMEIFQLRSVTSAVLVPMLMLTFPSVASNMTFMFMMHTSALAILMVCVGVYIARRYKWGVIPCGVLVILVLAIYQSYVAFVISLLIFGLMFDIFNDKRSGKEVFIEGVKYVVMLGVGVFIYIKLCWVFYPDLSSMTYGGVGNMGNIAISEMPHLILRCYKRVLDFFILKPFGFMSDTTHVLNIIVCALVAVLFIFVVAKKNIYQKDRLNFIFVLLLAFLSPFAMAFVYFMAPEVVYSMLMLYAYVLVYILLLGLLEQAEGICTKKKIGQATALVSAVVLFLVAYQNYLVTNNAYFRMDIAFQRTSAYYERIINRLEETEGYEYGDQVLIAGDFYYVDNPSPIEAVSMDDDVYRDFDGVAMENGMITAGVRNSFVRTYLGLDFPDVSYDLQEEIKNSSEYEEMPSYPSDGCIKKIQNVWVIKL
jgi:hypothetical protein